MAMSTLASGEWPQNLLCGRVVYLHDVGYVWLVRSLPTGTNICDDDLANATIFLAGRKHVCLLCWTHSTNSSGKFAPHSDGHSGKGESRCDTMSANMRQSISRTSKVPVVDLGWDTVMHRYFTRCETVNGPKKWFLLCPSVHHRCLCSAELQCINIWNYGSMGVQISVPDDVVNPVHSTTIFRTQKSRGLSWSLRPRETELSQESL